MGNQRYSFRQLLEIQACTGCRVCAEVCPAVAASGDGYLSGVYRLDWQRRVFKGRGGWLRRLWAGQAPTPDEWKQFSETVYRCTLCGRCQQACPVGIGLRDQWLHLREDLVANQAYPAKIDTISENLRNSYNVFNEDQEDRTEWVEDMDDPPEHEFIHDRAEVVYFTGCVASFFPMAQQIPIALAETFQRAGVDFTLLGEDERCCGFPLLGAGLLSEAKSLIEANLEAVAAKGAKEIVFACPSCYMMFKEHYPPEFKLTHSTQFLKNLIEQGRLPLQKLDLKVTYHDPCDLGRQAGEYDAPRQVIESLPGVELVEMANNRENCTCCGGGGNLEMIDQELNAKIAADKIEQALATGAQAVISACQQCVRTMATHTRRNRIDLQVMDISQLVRLALPDSD